MSNLDGLRDELWQTAARVARRSLTAEERSELVDAFNGVTGDHYERCRSAIKRVLGIDIGAPILFEKSASVDRVMLAISNLRAAAANAGAKK